VKKLAILFVFALAGALLIAQTTYNHNKYKQVFYDGTREKTHATFAAFDTAAVKIDATGTQPSIEIKGSTGTQLLLMSGGKLYAADSIKIGSSSNVWIREMLLSTTGDSLSIMYYNTPKSRIDTLVIDYAH